MNTKIEKKIKAVIAKCGENIDIAQIHNDTDLVMDLAYTSIDLIKLIVSIEDEFDIQFDNNDLILDKISSYKQLRKIVNNLLRN